jgi:hypothetical protein
MVPVGSSIQRHTKRYARYSLPSFSAHTKPNRERKVVKAFPDA